jgi:heat shock protein 90kDa beta
MSTALKIGVIEDEKNQKRILQLLRYESSSMPKEGYTSLDAYVENIKKGQKQIFYMAGLGMQRKDMEKSPFVEKLIARGYEVGSIRLYYPNQQ